MGGSRSRQIPMAIGASASRGYDFNFMTAPRKAKDAVGAIVRLEVTMSCRMRRQPFNHSIVTGACGSR